MKRTVLKKTLSRTCGVILICDKLLSLRVKSKVLVLFNTMIAPVLFFDISKQKLTKIFRFKFKDPGFDLKFKITNDVSSIRKIGRP